MSLKQSTAFDQREERNVKPLSATDVLAPTTMKNAAKCDTSCELQNPVSHQNFERILHFLGSMSVGVSVLSPPILDDFQSSASTVKRNGMIDFLSIVRISFDTFRCKTESWERIWLGRIYPACPIPL